MSKLMIYVITDCLNLSCLKESHDCPLKRKHPMVVEKGNLDAQCMFVRTLVEGFGCCLMDKFSIRALLFQESSFLWLL